MKRSPMPPRRRTATFRCQGCDSLFQRRADHRSRREDGRVLCTPCCSTAQGEARSGVALPAARRGSTVRCRQCGKEFYRKGADYRKSQTEQRFCSRSCFATWQIDHPMRNFIGSADNRGERNGRYKDGRRVGTNVSKKVVRDAVKSRDGDWCWLCGKPGPGLHLHRVVYGSQGGRYEEKNCVQLCGEHHAVVHSDKRKWLPLLLAHLETERPLK